MTIRFALGCTIHIYASFSCKNRKLQFDFFDAVGLDFAGERHMFVVSLLRSRNPSLLKCDEDVCVESNRKLFKNVLEFFNIRTTTSTSKS